MTEMLQRLMVGLPVEGPTALCPDCLGGREIPIPCDEPRSVGLHGIATHYWIPCYACGCSGVVARDEDDGPNLPILGNLLPVDWEAYRG